MKNLKKGIFALIAVFMLCGAGAMAETLAMQEGEHEVVVTAEQTSRNADYGESVYDIRVTVDGQETQVINFTTEGTNEGEDEIYVTDVNMDGYPDFALLRSMGASDGFASHYLYDPTSGEFVYHPELDDLSWYRCTFYPEGRYVLNYLHSGAATGNWELYQWQDDGALKLLATAGIELSDDIENNDCIAQASLIKEDGTSETVYTDQFSIENETAWNAAYDKILESIWNGVESGEAAEWGITK